MTELRTGKAMPYNGEGISRQAVEVGVTVALLVLSGLIFYETIRLGPGWGPSGPEPGFFPFVLNVCMTAGAVGVMIMNLVKPDRRPFFEASQEIEDLLKVGVPVAVAVLAVNWAGIYVTAGVYLAFFMAWYGRFRWYSAMAGGLVLPIAMWLTLREAFNISMPMTMFYHRGILPF